MEIVRASSVAEYAKWYLDREHRKRPAAPIVDPQDAIDVLRMRHQGKWRMEFEWSRWDIVRLDRSDFERLIFIESGWSKDARLVVPGVPNYRLLGVVAQRAEKIAYLSTPKAEQHREYLHRLRAGMALTGDDALVLRTATRTERDTNPDGSYYLHDGAGRSLPYMILVARGELPFAVVEAFLADGDFR
jgi:hypothetical protein